MFYDQPLAHRFGTALAQNIEDTRWARVEIAVAWVRRSGTQHLEPSFAAFLGRGGVAQVTVGVDIENTSEEGLRDLLTWQTQGNIETFVHHNEAEAIFHPKVYLLRNETDARLIVGSNNLTQAGLFVNTEAGLQLDAAVTDPLINDARTALAAWRDTAAGFAKRLDDLIRLGYIFPERQLQRRRKASQDKSKVKRHSATQMLFKAQKYSIPPVQRAATGVVQVPGSVVLMRVRRASETERRTQIQIPIRVVHTNFFAGVASLLSAHDGRVHSLIQATARGGLNTVKAEIPEIEPMTEPVLRLERTTSEITYQAFDGNSILGAPIKQALLNGFAMIPPATSCSIRDRDRATWWRFI